MKEGLEYEGHKYWGSFLVFFNTPGHEYSFLLWFLDGRKHNENLLWDSIFCVQSLTALTLGSALKNCNTCPGLTPCVHSASVRSVYSYHTFNRAQ